MSLWIAVETDQYELPLAVCDTRRELAECLGISENSIKSAILRHQDGQRSGRKFMKIQEECTL
jgi:hypothetical protein